MRIRKSLSMLMEHHAELCDPPDYQKFKEAWGVIDESVDVLAGGVGSGRLNQRQIQEAMTTADFALAIGEFVDRRMWPAYQQSVFGFEGMVFNDTVPNFLTVTRYQRQEGVDDLEMVRPKAPTRAGYLADAVKRQYRVYRWEKGFDFEMEAIINDDLGYFGDFTTVMGRAARRTIEKFVSRLYNNTTTIARLQALGALFSTTARISTNALMTAVSAFDQRVDGRGEPMPAAGINLVIHRGLRLTVQQILRSVQVAENANNAVNVLPAFNVIVDPYLTGTAPNLPWWLFSAPDAGGIRPLTLVRLAGRPGPFILQKTPDVSIFSGFGRVGGVVAGLGDYDTGNIMLKVADVWGGYANATDGGVTDTNGCYYSSGTVP